MNMNTINKTTDLHAFLKFNSLKENIRNNPELYLRNSQKGTDVNLR